MTYLLQKTPNVLYNGYISKNLLIRLSVVKSVLKRYELYYDYEIREGERPDTVASDYYGRSSYAWLVMIPNDIYDVNYDWPLTTIEFYDYLVKKYGMIYELQSKPSYYEYIGLPHETKEEIARINLKMCPFTWRLLPDEEKSSWKMVSVYENEERKNESKRTIKLISNALLREIENELTDLLK